MTGSGLKRNLNYGEDPKYISYLWILVQKKNLNVAIGILSSYISFAERALPCKS
jgi:hypothetical protein